MRRLEQLFHAYVLSAAPAGTVEDEFIQKTITLGRLENEEDVAALSDREATEIETLRQALSESRAAYEGAGGQVETLGTVEYDTAIAASLKEVCLFVFHGISLGLGKRFFRICFCLLCFTLIDRSATTE